MVNLRAVIRQLRRHWFRSALLAAIVAGAIAVPTSVFALVDGVLFRALPFRTPSELTLVRPERTSGSDRAKPSVSWALVMSWRERRPDLRSTVVNSNSTAWYQTPERDYWVASIDEHFFDVLGHQPVLGSFTDADFEWSAATAGAVTLWPVLITDRVWAVRFGRSPEAIGALIPVSAREGRTFGMKVAGVLPPNFVYPLVGETPAPDFVTPFSRRQRAGGLRNLQFVARVPSEVSRVRLSEELAAISRPTSKTNDPHPDASGSAATAPPVDVDVIPLREELVGQSLTIFRGAVALSVGLLIMGLSNVLGLWLAEVESSHDILIRRSLGAKAVDLFLLIGTRALFVTVSGLFVASLFIPVLVSMTVALLPQSLPLLKTPEVDIRVATFAAGISILSALVLAIAVTAAVSKRSELQPQRGRKRRKLLEAGPILLTVQAAVGTCLAAVATVAGASWLDVWIGSPGYNPSNRFLIEARANGYMSASDATEQIAKGFEALQRQLPGVKFAASSLQPTFQLGSPSSTLSPAKNKTAPEGSSLRAVTGNYFEVLDIAVLEGGSPRPDEWLGTSPVAVVSRTAAERFWPGQDAIGQRLYNSVEGEPFAEYTVAAVVEDAKYVDLDMPSLSDVYIPAPFSGGRSAALIVGTGEVGVEHELESAVSALKGEGLRVVRALMLEEAMFGALKHRALPAWLFGLAAVVGLPILALGVVAGAAIKVQRSRRDMAIRIALGANYWSVCKDLLQAQWLGIGLGTIAGLIGAYSILRADLIGLGGLNEIQSAGLVVPTALVIACLIALSVIPVLAGLTRDQTAALKSQPS